MENLKITQILKSLSAEEFRKLGKFVNSPFINESPLMIKLYDLFRQLYPKFEGLNKREIIFDKLYPGEKYDEHRLRDRFSEFVKITEKFLVFNSVLQDKHSFDLHLLSSLKKNNANNIFEKELLELLKDAENYGIKDEIYFKNQYELKELLWDYQLSHHTAGSTEILEGLSSEISDIINFFIIKIFKSYLSIINGQENINYDYRFALFEDLLKYMEKEILNYKNVKIIYILYHFFQLYHSKTGDDKYFELKDMVIENENSIDKKYLGILYVELINYCKWREEQQSPEFGKESLELIKYMLKQGLLFESDNTLHAHNYSSIAASALRLNDITWAEDFINEYKKYILPERRENSYLYNMSILNFVKSKNNAERKKQYLDESLKFLSMVKCRDFYDKTMVNNHLLVIYYELGYIDQSISLIDSYRHFLSSNSLIPEDQKCRYNNFIKFLSRIINLHSYNSRTNREKLINDIKSVQDCENRKWLLSKINEID